jgi:hypothetical protein
MRMGECAVWSNLWVGLAGVGSLCLFGWQMIRADWLESGVHAAAVENRTAWSQYEVWKVTILLCT